MGSGGGGVGSGGRLGGGQGRCNKEVKFLCKSKNGFGEEGGGVGSGGGGGSG